MSKQTLPESKRTVVFRQEEAKAISEIAFSFDAKAAAEAVDEVGQHLLNYSSDQGEAIPDVGDCFFIIRKLRDFHSMLIDRLKPVAKAYQETV